MSTSDDSRSEHEPTEPQGLNLHAAKRSVRRHWRGASLIVLLALALASIYTAFRTPLYRVKALVLLENTAPSFVPGTDTQFILTRDLSEAQRGLACTRPVLERAITIARAARPADPVLSPTSASVLLFDPLETIIDGQLLALNCYNPDPARATALANAWMLAFVDEMKLRGGSSTKGESDFLEKEVEELRTKWTDALRALQQYAKDSTYDPKIAESDPVRQRYAYFSEQLTAAQAQQANLRSEAKELESAKGDPQRMLLLPRARKDEKLVSYVHLILEQEKKLAEAKTRFRDDAELVQKIEQILRDLREKELQHAGLLAKEIRIELSIAEDLVGELTVYFDAAKQERQDINSKSGEYQRLASNVEMAKKVYDDINSRASSAQVASGYVKTNVKPWEYGEVPIKPYLPSWPKSLAVGLIVGLLLGAGFIYLREVTDATVHSDSQLKDTLGVNVLGTVPLLDVRLSGNCYHLLESHPRTLASENMRSLRMSLILACSSHRGLVILVTSPGQSDGKSVIASNLAVAFAEQGRRTLMIDGDVYKGTLSVAWDCDIDRGLSSLLNGGSSFTELARPAGIENLFLIPAGKKIPTPAKLWECEGLDETLEKARSDYDLTIVDSPPLLAVSDSHTLARKCDATLLVVRSRRTQFGHIRRAIDILVRAHARQSFFVVNGLDSSDAEAAGYGYGYGYGGYGYGGYGYGYGYGYGHGHRRGDDAETSASHEPEAGQDASHRDRSNSRGQKAG